MQKNIILSMFEQKLFNLPCWPDINEHTAKEISQWSDLVEPLDWFPPLLCKIIWLYNRKFVKLLGLFLIRCVFTKKILGGQKFVKTGTGKNRGFPEHCAMYNMQSTLISNCYLCMNCFLCYQINLRLKFFIVCIIFAWPKSLRNHFSYTS